MEIVVLGRGEIADAIDMEEVITGVESAYKQKAEGNTLVWPLVSHDFIEEEAVMDIRSGALVGDKIHGLKMLNNFPHNSEVDLPVFNGMLMVFDSNTGIPLGILDASYITCMRTGAAGALGVKYFAKTDSRSLLIVGAGTQSLYQIAAALVACPHLTTVRVANPHNTDKAHVYVADLPERLKNDFGIDGSGVVFEAVDDLPTAVGKSDAIIMITRSRTPLIKKEWVAPGTHFSCVGADMEGKEELDPTIFEGAKIFCDDITQCVSVGECEIPVKEGIITKENLQGEIGQYLTGEIDGRKTSGEITIFDATGLAILDLITAKTVIKNAREQGVGTVVNI